MDETEKEDTLHIASQCKESEVLDIFRVDTRAPTCAASIFTSINAACLCDVILCTCVFTSGLFTPESDGGCIQIRLWTTTQRKWELSTETCRVNIAWVSEPVDPLACESDSIEIRRWWRNRVRFGTCRCSFGVIVSSFQTFKLKVLLIWIIIYLLWYTMERRLVQSQAQVLTEREPSAVRWKILEPSWCSFHGSSTDELRNWYVKSKPFSCGFFSSNLIYFPTLDITKLVLRDSLGSSTGGWGMMLLWDHTETLRLLLLTASTSC